jgi:hypothetical protein
MFSNVGLESQATSQKKKAHKIPSDLSNSAHKSQATAHCLCTRLAGCLLLNKAGGLYKAVAVGAVPRLELDLVKHRVAIERVVVPAPRLVLWKRRES